jgi:hypothetical protein
VFVIDEAQNLTDPVLESIRLLSDFESSRGKLLQIILAGQTQLIQTLMKTEMLQLTQRISVTQFLDPLNATEVMQYVRHRLGVAGYEGKPLFTSAALQAIAAESGGIPRNINNICFGAMSTAFALGMKSIGVEIIEEVAGEQNLKSLGKRVHPSLNRAVNEAPASERLLISAASPDSEHEDEDRAMSIEPTRTGLWRRMTRPGWLVRYTRSAASLLVVLLAMVGKVAA